MNNKWLPGSHIFQQTGTIFELVQDNIGTNLLTKFHEDPTINVASTVLTRQIFMTHDGRQTFDKRWSRNFTMSKKYYAHKDCHHVWRSASVIQIELKMWLKVFTIFHYKQLWYCGLVRLRKWSSYKLCNFVSTYVIRKYLSSLIKECLFPVRMTPLTGCNSIN